MGNAEHMGCSGKELLMRTEKEIKIAMKQCSEARNKDDPKLCPVWPKDDYLYCVDCTCRHAWRWVLEEKVDI